MIHSYLLSIDLTRVRTIVPVASSQGSDEVRVDGCGDAPMRRRGEPWREPAPRHDAQAYIERAKASPA